MISSNARKHCCNRNDHRREPYSTNEACNSIFTDYSGIDIFVTGCCAVFSFGLCHSLVRSVLYAAMNSAQFRLGFPRYLFSAALLMLHKVRRNHDAMKTAAGHIIFS